MSHGHCDGDTLLSYYTMWSRVQGTTVHLRYRLQIIFSASQCSLDWLQFVSYDIVNKNVLWRSVKPTHELMKSIITLSNNSQECTSSGL